MYFTKVIYFFHIEYIFNKVENIIIWLFRLLFKYIHDNKLKWLMNKSAELMNYLLYL